MSSTYIYNQIVEDTRIDLAHLKIKSDDRIFTICAAGDHLLYYLIDNPQKIVACDINPHQIYLAELKISYMKVCTYDEYFSIFGDNNSILFLNKYPSASKYLSEQARFFWSQNGKKYSKSWAYNGSSGILMKFILYYIFTFTTHLKKLVDNIINGSVKKDDYLNNKKNIDDEILSVFSHVENGISLLGGVPSNQLNLIESHKRKDYCIIFIDKIFKDMDYFIKHNFILFSYFTGKYTRDNCPLYMKQKYYDIVKSRLDRIELCHGPIIDTILMYEKPFTIYVSLDHLDWMNYKEVEKELAIVTRQMRKGKILFKSFRDRHINGHFNPLLNRFHVNYIDDKNDIFPSYFSIGLFEFDEPYLTGQNYIPNNMLHYLYVLKTMLIKGVQDKITRITNNDSHDNFVIDYYKDQSDMYDMTRYVLLKKRDQLIKSIKLNGIWIDLACGTGSNLEYLSSDDLLRFQNIILVDISPDLCEIAKRRIERMRLNNASVICTDILTLNEKNNLNSFKNKVNLITISYSLTMIPSWKQIIQKSIELLSKDGFLCICDFTENPNDIQDQWWKWWFSNNHVYMNNEQLIYLRESVLKTEYVQVDKQNVPLLPMLQTSHYLYIGRKI